MDDAEYTWRRRWSDEEKRAIMELAHDPECSVADVAHTFEVLPAGVEMFVLAQGALTPSEQRTDRPGAGQSLDRNVIDRYLPNPASLLLALGNETADDHEAREDVAADPGN